MRLSRDKNTGAVSQTLVDQTTAAPEDLVPQRRRKVNNHGDEGCVDKESHCGATQMVQERPIGQHIQNYVTLVSMLVRLLPQAGQRGCPKRPRGPTAASKATAIILS